MDTQNNISKRLSYSAVEELNSIQSEFKEILLEKANEYSKRSSTKGKEISLSDLIDAKNDIFGKKNNDTIELLQIIKNGLRSIYTGILMLIMGGATILMLSFIQKSPLLFDKISITIFIVLGLLLILFGLLGLSIIVNKKKRDIESQMSKANYKNLSKIVIKWNAIENLTSHLMTKNGVSEENSKSIKLIISQLDKMLKNDEEKEDLKKLLQVRNRIIHENLTLSTQEEIEMIKIANHILMLIEEKLGN